jgi:ketosteroid isomerase-like protein
MPESNVDIVRRGFVALETLDLDALVAGWDPDVVWDVSGYDGWPGEHTVYRGPATILAEFGRFMTTIESQEVDVKEIRELDPSRVLALYTEVRRDRRFTEPTTLDVGIVYTLAEGRIVHMAVHTGHDRARRAAGVR